MFSIAERVQNGIAYLNGNYPGWVEKIDVKILRMDSSCRCIMGQVVGDYEDYFDKMETELGEYPHPWLCEHGFNDETYMGKEELQKEWEKQINRLTQ